MTPLHAELLVFALILVRAFYCLRVVPARPESYTTSGGSDDVPREIPTR
jgi:hypothetical protein